MNDIKPSECLFADLKTDAQRRDWFLLGRGVETGIIAPALQTPLAIAYSKLVESGKLIEQQQKRIDELEAQLNNYPMQPLVLDEDGTLRFEANPIVEWLATEVSDMNQTAAWAAENNVPNKYREQLAQMVGYSVRGYGTLSYVSDESYNRAVAALPQPTEEKNDE